jgi:hypothetical protein
MALLVPSPQLQTGEGIFCDVESHEINFAHKWLYRPLRTHERNTAKAGRSIVPAASPTLA